MKRKNKVRLITIIILPLLILVSTALNTSFSDKLLWSINHLAILFPIFCLFFIITTLIYQRRNFKNKRPAIDSAIKSGNDRKQIPFVSWLFFLLFIELSLFALFIMQATMFLNHSPNGKPILKTTNNICSLILPIDSWKGICAWSLLATITVAFSHFSLKNAITPFNQFCPTLRNKFATNILKAIPDLLIKTATKLFICTIIVMITSQIYYFIFPTNNIFGLLSSIIMIGGIFFIFIRSFFRKMLAKTNSNLQHLKKLTFLEKRISFIFSIKTQLLLMPLLLIALGAISGFATSFLPTHSPWLTQPVKMAAIPAAILLKLWGWSFWIMCIPTFASLITRFSHGRNTFAIIIAILLLPLALIFSINYGHISIDTIYKNHLFVINVTATIISTIFLIKIFFNKSIRDYLWLGFIPTLPTSKQRIIPLKPFWLMLIAVLFICIDNEFVGLQVLLATVTIPCFVVFSILSLSYFKKLTYQKQTD